MPELIDTPRGRFTAEAEGPPDGPLVLLLHGFPQCWRAWRAQTTALAASGYRAVAFDQRGYSAGARPPPNDAPAYCIEQLVTDVIDVADALVGNEKRFHLAGHGWGAHVAWVVAGRRGDRLASLAALSRPHPAAYRRALNEDADGQQYRSRRDRTLGGPGTAARLLEHDARGLRHLLADNRVPPPAIAEYLAVLGTHAALDAALAWFRATPILTDAEAGLIDVPTLYLWGDADPVIGPSAAGWSGEYMRAAYRFETLLGVGHFMIDEAPAAVTTHLLAHLAAHPAEGRRAPPEA